MNPLPPPSSFLPVSSLSFAPLSLHPSQPTSTSNGSTPSLPTELHKEILRFCDSSTLRETSLVNLAFLELSTPLLYHDVEIRGCEQLYLLLAPRMSSLLFSEPFRRQRKCPKLTSPSSPTPFPFPLQTLPSLLSDSTNPLPLPIHTLRFSHVGADDPFSNTQYLLNSIPSQPPLRLHQLDFRLPVNRPTLTALCRLFHPKNLVIRAPFSHATRLLNLDGAVWSRLQTIRLVGPVGVGGRMLKEIASTNFPRLRTVTYDLSPFVLAESTPRLVGNIVDDLPLPETVQVVVLGASKRAKKVFDAILKSRLENGRLPARVKDPIALQFHD